MIPSVEIGTTTDRTVAPVIAAMVERGLEQRPDLAAGTEGRVRLRFAEGWPPTVIVFDGHGVLVYDDDGSAVDTEIRGELPDVVAVIAAPLRGGVPNPITREGRAALARLAQRHVEIDGAKALAWRLLRLLSLAG